MICAHCGRTDAPAGPCHGCGSTIHVYRTIMAPEPYPDMAALHRRMAAISESKSLLAQVVLGESTEYRHGHAVLPTRATLPPAEVLK